MKKPSLISLITICKNSAETIEQTIDSVLSQDSTNFEYIIIDGKSTDTTLEIIEKYIPKFLNSGITIKIVSEKDKGISDAFNKGLYFSSGDLIGFVNSDDWLEPDCISILNYYLDDKHDIYCGSIRVHDKFNKNTKIRKSRPYLLALGMYINHPATFVKRKLALAHKFDTNLKIAMDYDYLLRLSKKGARIKVIDKVLSNMRKGGISDNYELAQKEEMVVIARYFPSFIILLNKIIRFTIKKVKSL